MRVLPRDRRALVPDDLSHEHIRKPGRLKHRHSAVAQAVKRNDFGYMEVPFSFLFGLNFGGLSEFEGAKITKL